MLVATIIFVAKTPPTVAVLDAKLVPSIIIFVPPLIEPEFGVTEVIVGSIKSESKVGSVTVNVFPPIVIVPLYIVPLSMTAFVVVASDKVVFVIVELAAVTLVNVEDEITEPRIIVLLVIVEFVTCELSIFDKIIVELATFELFVIVDVATELNVTIESAIVDPWIVDVETVELLTVESYINASDPDTLVVVEFTIAPGSKVEFAT